MTNQINKVNRSKQYSGKWIDKLRNQKRNKEIYKEIS